MTKFLDLLHDYKRAAFEIERAGIAIDTAERLDAQPGSVAVRALKAVSQSALRTMDALEVEMLAMIAPEQRGHFLPSHYFGDAKKKAAALLKQSTKPATSKRGQ